MLRFELTITGQDTSNARPQRGGGRLAPARVMTTYDWAELHVMRYLSVRPYPPERPGQRYKRTGRLGRSWKVSTRGQSVIIENTAPYSGYVVGDGAGQRQAWFHRGRWWLMRDMVDEKRPELKRMMVQMLTRQLKSNRPAIARAAGWQS
jgi:hypothetical protein